MNQKRLLKRFLCLFLMATAGISCVSCAVFDTGKRIPTKEENGKNIRLGAYVWYGYSTLAWGAYTERYLEDFATFREPVWGHGYTEVEDMEYQIDLALENGLSFFAFEYWWNVDAVTSVYMNQGLNQFMKAKNKDKLDFCLLVANHDQHVVTYDNWDEVSELFVHYMSQPNALKVDGKPVIQFFLGEALIKDLGGPVKAKQCFDSLRETMKEKGYPDILIVGCDTTGGGNPAYVDASVVSVPDFTSRMNKYAEAGLDAVGGALTYRAYPQFSWNEESDLRKNFQDLLDLHEKSWQLVAENTGVRLTPSLAAGWDDRLKWDVFSPPTYFYTREKTGDKFYQHVLNAYDWIQKNPDNALGNIAFIYSWDETDEGAQLIPTHGEGYEMLHALRRAVRDINGK